jgi:death-on-curing protein
VIFIDTKEAVALHDELIAKHGGLSGIRDLGLLESALGRPRNLVAYGESDSIADLAASYCFGLAKNHPFNDGNKRTAATVFETFLLVNGFNLTADEAATMRAVLDIAASKITEKEFSIWIGQNIQALKPVVKFNPPKP